MWDEENQKDEKEKLPGPWREIQGAIWLIGLAVLFWQSWFWPGILVVIAISAIFEAVVRLVIKPSQQLPATETGVPAAPAERSAPDREQAAVRLPSRCPNCGAPISEEVVNWSNDHQHASCPYCKSNISLYG